MNTRNAKYNDQGTIDCEINHPKYGWIPFTASPDDSEQHGKDIYAALIDAGNVAPYVEPVVTAEQELQILNSAKEAQKAQLRAEKLDSMLILEFEEIDAAATNADVKKVKIK